MLVAFVAAKTNFMMDYLAEKGDRNLNMCV